jgi:nucleoside-diphosphate-sugar epimerase
MKRKVLLTGSAGFVGKELLKELVKEHEVVSMDKNESSGNLGTFYKVDMRSEIDIPVNSWDVVIHCAAAKGDWNILDDDFYFDNVVATRNLLNYLRKCKVGHLIHFSTVAVYSRENSIGDETTLLEPNSVYGQTKLESELLIKEYAAENLIPTVVLRPSVIYGRNNYANMYNLIKLLNRGYPFQINPEGIVKSHVSILNVVDVVMNFVIIKHKVDGLEIYNLTERPYLNLNSLLDIICSELGVKTPTINIPLWLVSALFSFLGSVGKLVRRDLGFTKERLQKLSSSTHYTSEKLWDLMGGQIYKSEDQLRDMVKWFKEEKL